MAVPSQAQPSMAWDFPRPTQTVINCLLPNFAEIWRLYSSPVASAKNKRRPKGVFYFWCERWDLNPHVYSDTSTSSLPVCRFQHARLSLTDLTIIPNPDHLSSGRGGFPYQTLLVFFQMPMCSACLMRSSRKEGWAMLMSSSARSQVVLPFRSAAPYSVTT